MQADQGYDPRTGAPAGAPVPHTTTAAVDEICRTAAAAAPALAATSPPQRAALLRAASDALGSHTDEIVALADQETGLGAARLTGELTRTRRQWELFADAVTEGSYLEAIIDLPDPAAQPAPRPDLRRMLVPTGPVAVYAASNFPLAFSVPGGDTASALAAGCPVVVKAHPSHPGLSARIGAILTEALTAAGAPAGTLGLVYGQPAGVALVQHPAITAVAFTGSLAGGRALFDLACARPDPVPFYGELGALNPVVVTPGALAARAEQIVAGYTGSYLLGSGQFCTKPGLLFLPADHGLAPRLVEAVRGTTLGPLLNQRIQQGYGQTAAQLAAVPGVSSLLPDPPAADQPGWAAAPVLLSLSAATLVAYADQLLVECFGPASLLVEYADQTDLLAALDVLPGSLTASLHAEVDDEPDLTRAVLDRLVPRAGRVVVGGWPTGVAVTWATHHGGPWPATTHSGHTSVGVTAMRRFLRPVAFQDTPAALLPAPLREDNPWQIPRRVNGTLVLPG